MKAIYDVSIPIIITIVTICAVTGWMSAKILGPDNAVEEAAEEVIKVETGKDIDLTPSTPEVKKESEAEQTSSFPASFRPKVTA